MAATTLPRLAGRAFIVLFWTALTIFTLWAFLPLFVAAFVLMFAVLSSPTACGVLLFAAWIALRCL